MLANRSEERLMSIRTSFDGEIFQLDRRLWWGRVPTIYRRKQIMVAHRTNIVVRIQYSRYRVVCGAICSP